MADSSISTPKEPSALDLSGLTCGALPFSEIEVLPDEFARTTFLGAVVQGRSSQCFPLQTETFPTSVTCFLRASK
jgi:hypothetical protein